MKQLLTLQDCLGLRPVDRLYYVAGEEINPATGHKYAENPDRGYAWDDEYFQKNFGGGYSANNGGRKYGESDIAYAQRIMKEAAQPAIDSYKASIPEVQAKYAAAKTTAEGRRSIYEDRYNQLLDQINQSQTGETNATIKNTAREFGRRGVALSSTEYGNEQNAAVDPITHYYTGQKAAALTGSNETNLNLDELIANLTSGEVGDERAIQNAIAQLQMGAATSGLSSGIQLNAQTIQQQLAQADAAAKAKQDDIANSLAERMYQNVSLPQSQAAVAASQASTAAKSAATGSTSATDWLTQQQTQGKNDYNSILRKYGLA